MDDIIAKLTTISKIEDGYTLSSLYDTVVLHNSWSTSFWRTYNLESRKKTVTYIRDTFNSAVDLLKSGIEADQLTLKSYILEALNGFSHLKVTYKGDFEIIGLISTIIDDVNKKINDQAVEYCLADQTNQFFNDLIANDYQAIEKYLYDGHLPNIVNYEGKNAFHFICNKLYYNAKILNLLHNFNVDPTLKDFYGNSPLNIAVNTGCAEAVIFLETIIGKKKLRD